MIKLLRVNLILILTGGIFTEIFDPACVQMSEDKNSCKVCQLSYWHPFRLQCVYSNNSIANAFSYANLTTVQECLDGFVVSKDQLSCSPIPLEETGCV